MSQIPDDPRKTKQIISNLQLAVGERTEIAVNARTEDGMTMVLVMLLEKYN